MSELKTKDIELWKRWKSTRSTSDLEALLKQMNPVIQKEVNRWSGQLARPLLELEARSIAAQSFETYNENMGAALSTYLTGSLKKLSRINYVHQTLAYNPEYKRLDIETLFGARNRLENELDRPPSNLELADHLGWSRSKVTALQKLNRPEHLELQENMPMVGTPQEESGQLDLIYHDLNPFQRSLFEHVTGYGGKDALSNKDLMSKFKLTQGQLSYERRKLKDAIEKHLK